MTECKVIVPESDRLAGVLSGGLQQVSDVEVVAPATKLLELQQPDGRHSGAEEEQDGELEPEHESHVRGLIVLHFPLE